MFAFLLHVHAPDGGRAVENHVHFAHSSAGVELASSAVAWVIHRQDGWLHCGGSGAWSSDGMDHPFRMDIDGSRRSALDGPRRFSLMVYEPGGEPGTDSPIYRASGIVGAGSVRIYR